MSLTRTSGSGLVDRNEYDNGSFPFATGDWTVPTGWSKSLISGRLVIQSSGDHAPNFMTRDMTALGEMMVFSRVDLSNNIQFGAGVLISNITAGSQDGIEAGMAHGFSGGRFLTRWTAGAVVAIDFTGSGINISTTDARVSVWANANNAAMYDFQNAAIESGVYNPPVSSKTGEPGIFADFSATGQQFNVEKFFVFNGRYITVTGLQSGSGQKAKLRKSDGTVLAQATEVSGTATIDCLTVEEWWNVDNLQITTSGDVELEEYVGEVWAGETWAAVVDFDVITATIASTATLYAPSVALGVTVAFIASTATLFGPAIPVPVTPTITAEATGPRSVTVGGSTYSHPDSVPIGGVEWRRATNAGMSTGLVAVEIPYADPGDAPSPLTYGWADLEPGTTYWFDVRYQDENGSWSARSAAVSEDTDVEIPPSTPTITTAVPGTNDVSLVASAYVDSQGRAHVSSDWQIDVAAGTFASPVNESLDDVSVLTAENLAGLNPGTAYKARVRYRAADGSYSAWSASKSFTTLTAPANRPAQPTVTVSEIEQTSARFTGSTYSDPTSSAHYQTRWYVTNWPGGGTFGVAYRVLDVTVTAPSALLTYLATVLQPDVDYNVAVRYRAADGDWSDWSPWVPFTTVAAPIGGGLLQITKPRQGEPVRGTAVPVAWTPTSFVGSTFELEYSANLGAAWSWVALASGVASSPYSWNVSGLTDGVYILRIRAVAGTEVTDWQYRILYVDNANLQAGGTYLFNYNADNPSGDGGVIGDWDPIWNEENMEWTLDTPVPQVRYTSEAFVLEESGFAFLPAFQPRQVDVIGEFVIGSLGGSFPWNWFPEQAFAGVGVFADGPFIAGRGPQDGVYVMAFTVPISAYGDCELRGSGPAFLEIAAFENGTNVYSRTIPVGRLHVVNFFSGCNKVPRYGIRLRLTTVSELGDGRRRLRLQTSIWGRGIDVPAEGWHHEGTFDCGLDCGRAAFVARNANTTNGPYRVFSNLTVIPYEYGGCEGPVTFEDPVELETCPPPIFDLTIFDDDGVTPLFGSVDEYGNIDEPSFSTWPGHPRPWLVRWPSGSEHEVDPISGGSNVGVLLSGVLDKRVDPCDQQSGLLSAVGGDDLGFSAYIGRRAVARERLSDGTYQVVQDGPIMEVLLLDTRVTYQFKIGSMRERERQVPAFDTQYETFSAYPYGPVNGYGYLGQAFFSTFDIWLQQPAAIARGRYVRVDANPLEGVIFGKLENLTVFDYGSRIELTELGQPEAVYDLAGFVGRFYPKFILRWRYPGETAWRYVYDMPATTSAVVTPQGYIRQGSNAFVLEETDTIFRLVFEWPAVVLISTALNAFFEDEDTLPTIGADVEFQILANTTPSKVFPFVYDGTMGNLLRRLYDGDYSPDAPGVRYDEACMTLFEDTGPGARLWKMDSTDDLREWVEKNIYQAAGWLPSLNEDGSICPIDVTIPDSAEGLVELDNAVVMDADWSQDGSRALPIVTVRFKRDWTRQVSEDPDVFELYSEDAYVTQASARAGSLLRNAKALVMEPETIRSIGGPLYEALNNENMDEAPRQLATSRALALTSQFAFGPQIVPVRVRITATTVNLRVGQWVVLDLDWIPNLSNLTRGGPQLGLIVSRKKDPGLALDLTLILLGPGLTGLLPPEAGVPTVGPDNEVCVYIDVPEEYEEAGGGTPPPGSEGGGGGGGGGGEAGEGDVIDWDPSPLADTAALRDDPTFAVGRAINYEEPPNVSESGSGGSLRGYELVTAPASLAALSGVTKAMRYNFDHGSNGCTTLTVLRYIEFPTALSEMWCEIWHQFSTNFSTSNAACIPNDHKWVQFDDTGSENSRFMFYIGNNVPGAHGHGVETPWRVVGSSYEPGTGIIGGYDPTAGPRPTGFTPEDLWTSNVAHRYRFHIKPSRSGAIMRWRIDDQVIHDETGFGVGGNGGAGSIQLTGMSFHHNKDDGPANTLMHEWWGRIRVYSIDPGWGW